MSETSQLKNLSEIKNGTYAYIEDLQGNLSECDRLREMGFCENARIEKIADHGALICKVCDARVMISEEMARNIIVSEQERYV